MSKFKIGVTPYIVSTIVAFAHFGVLVFIAYFWRLMELRRSEYSQASKRGLNRGVLTDVGVSWLDTYNRSMRRGKGNKYHEVYISGTSAYLCAVIGWEGGSVRTKDIALISGWERSRATKRLRLCERDGWVYNTRRGRVSTWKFTDEGRGWFECLRAACGANWERCMIALREYARESLCEELRVLGWVDGVEALAMRVELEELRRRVRELGG